MAIVLGNTTITGLAAGGLPSNVITAANLNGNGAWTPTGGVVKMSVFRNYTREAASGNPVNAYGMWTTAGFTKARADTNIIIQVTVFGAGYSSGQCGIGTEVDGVWDYGHGYQYDGSYTAKTLQCHGTSYYTGLAAGSHTLKWGWKPGNGTTGERPFDVLNPNNNDDSRNGQVGSTMVVYEVAP
jgi:hypothetical protein